MSNQIFPDYHPGSFPTQNNLLTNPLNHANPAIPEECELAALTRGLRNMLRIGEHMSQNDFFNPQDEILNGDRMNRVRDLLDHDEAISGEALLYITKILSSIYQGRLPECLRDTRVREFLAATTRYEAKLSPLHFCIRRNMNDHIAMILDAGANVFAIEKFDYSTPLELATYVNNVFAVEKLLERGAGGQFGAEKALEIASFNNVKGDIVEMLKACMRPSLVEETYEDVINLVDDNVIKVRRDVVMAESLIDRIQHVASHRGGIDMKREETITGLMARLRAHRDYRTPETLSRLRNELFSLTQLRHNLEKLQLSPFDETPDVEHATRCPICYNVPNRAVYSCVTCHNIVCGDCKRTMEQDEPEHACPHCRSPEELERNRAVERVLESLYNLS